jgi:predicted nucleic acid-binding protein
MNAERATYRALYIDSSAIVKLAVLEPESEALRRYVRRRHLISSALARTEVARALLPLGADAVERGHDVLARIDLVRVNDRVLRTAGTMLPADLRSLDAIHLATARQLGSDLARIVTYDHRMSVAARSLGFTVTAPG